MPVIPALGRQKDYKFKASLGYIAGPCLKERRKEKKRKEGRREGGMKGGREEGRKEGMKEGKRRLFLHQLSIIPIKGTAYVQPDPAQRLSAGNFPSLQDDGQQCKRALHS
jgi:hypothetical protein